MSVMVRGKVALISKQNNNNFFSGKMMSDEQLQIFHTDDSSPQVCALYAWSWSCHKEIASTNQI